MKSVNRHGARLVAGPLGKLIRAKRVAAGISVAELAAGIGITAGAVWHWEHGLSFVRKANREVLSMVLHISDEEWQKADIEQDLLDCPCSVCAKMRNLPDDKNAATQP
jgi:transcriptional regulator with XRE-family HTH domain